MMICPQCHKKQASNWRYCPYCGLKIKRGGLLNSINKLFNHLVNGLNKKSKSNSFTIKIKRPGRQIIKSNKEMLKLPDKPKEPEVTIRKRVDGLELLIELPGINSLKNINLMHLGESLEIRAVKDDKGYFKIISVPEDYKIINKSINNEVLAVKMA